MAKVMWHITNFQKYTREASVLVDSDADLAKKHDFTSKLWKIIFPMDKTSSEISIPFKCYKWRRVTRSILSAQVFAFVDMLNNPLALRHQLEHALGRSVSMHLLTDSKSLFDIIRKGFSTIGKRIMIEIYGAGQSCIPYEISDIGFVQSNDNIVDNFTKPKILKSLFQSLKTGTWSVNCQQLIRRRS